MEGFVVFLVILCAIFSSVSKTKKAAQQQAKQKAAHGASPQAARSPKAQQTSFAQAAKKQAARQPSAGSLGPVKPMESTEGMSGYQVMTHRLEPLGRRTEYTGSLGGTSTEGEDLCDPSLGHAQRDEASAESVYASAIGAEPTLAFDRQSLLNGVVMNEILTRPAQRKWGRLYHG